MKEVNSKKVKLYSKREMMDLVVVNGKARGIIALNMINGEEKDAADAVVLATGGYGNVFFINKCKSL